MKTVIAFWAAVLAFAGGWLCWRNRKRYMKKSVVWLISKSVTELLVLLLTASVLPALLIVWLVVWITRPIKTPWVRTVIGVLSGISFAFMSSFALEALIFLGIFAIDMKTGEHEGGFLHCWKQAKSEQSTDMPMAA
jgi:hypothetical protein